ncbi:MAG: rhodanese-like domain-containing protein [Leptolyngbyaceae cyanobacterium SL_5_9]|nr:rhodanese-like domain-containing protein [Leptolyngbyaceae cyanobacterium SL_5_9]NJO73023.1 rhodanese-like domain-containing protein [Leptolyngbyaceae cyanobacterium RM1_406_9]
MADLQDAIANAKDKLPDVTPTPPGFHPQATATELKGRLQWGEPALTIVDVRDRDSFNACRIMGAITMQMDSLVERAESSLEHTRDIYVYGANDQETASAASTLREAGFQKVAELKGGLNAWTEIGGPVEGTSTPDHPVSAGEYNVVSRMGEFVEERKKED